MKRNNKQPITTHCKDCGSEFTITVTEQERFAQLNYDLPKRCMQCRNHRRKARIERKEAEARAKEQAAAAKRQQEGEIRLNSLLSNIPFKATTVENIDLSNPEQALFIIGNGFDLMHGIPSSYWDFQKSLGKHNELRYYLETYIKCDNLWSDFENNLAHLDAGAMLDVVDMWLQIYDAYDPDAKAADYYSAIDIAMLPIEIITDKLPKRFRQWVDSLVIDPQKKPLANLLYPSARYLSFNYTDTLEISYDVPATSINYIHGCRKNKKDSLILGHVPDVDYLDEYQPAQGLVPQYQSKRKNALLDNAMDIGATQWISYYDEQTTKHTPEIIESNRPYWDLMTDIESIVTIGHSLAKVDYPYFSEIVRYNNGKAEWYIGYHSSQDLQRITTFVNMMGLEISKIHIFRT